jgi:protoheme IX farnesyltransferase
MPQKWRPSEYGNRSQSYCGWAAATRNLSLEAWLLYTMLFLWQFPHFMAIAWMYRGDYSRAGYVVLPRGEQGGRFMSWQTLVASLDLIPVSLSPTVIGGASRVYFVVACILSFGFFCYSAHLAFRRSKVAARRLLMASIIYLPLALFLMVLDKLFNNKCFGEAPSNGKRRASLRCDGAIVLTGV